MSNGELVAVVLMQAPEQLLEISALAVCKAQADLEDALLAELLTHTADVTRFLGAAKIWCVQDRDYLGDFGR